MHAAIFRNGPLGGVRSNHGVLQNTCTFAPKPELYDLSADPNATRNLAEHSKATLETIAAQLEAFDRRLSEQGGKSAGTELTSSEMQELASLGYVGLEKHATAVNPSASGTEDAKRERTKAAQLGQQKP